jgi:ferric-dicitrate binding protein FerR (iron transport regulator)
MQSKSGASGMAGLSLHNEKGAATLVATLEDGSIVYLAEGARLDYPGNFPGGSRTVYLKGRALFEVSKNTGRPFLIETERMIIEVTGTAFDVESNDNTLSVRSGEVKATVKKSGQSLHVRKGETAAISGGRLTVEQTADGNRFARYMELLRFKGEKLGNILRVINNRESGIELCTTPALDGRQITVTFAGNEPAENIAEVICNAFDLELHKDEGKQQLLISAKP